MLEFSTKLGQNFKKYIYICNNFTDFFPKTGGASVFPSFYGCYDIDKHFPVKSKLKQGVICDNMIVVSSDERPHNYGREQEPKTLTSSWL